MARNNLTLEDLLGLKDTTLTVNMGVEEDLLKTMNDFVRESQEYEEKKREFVKLFKDCYYDIVKVIQYDPNQFIAVNCAGCRYANKVDLGYGKATTKRSKTNGKKPTI